MHKIKFNSIIKFVPSRILLFKNIISAIKFIPVKIKTAIVITKCNSQLEIKFLKYFSLSYLLLYLSHIFSIFIIKNQF